MNQITIILSRLIRKIELENDYNLKLIKKILIFDLI